MDNRNGYQIHFETPYIILRTDQSLYQYKSSTLKIKPDAEENSEELLLTKFYYPIKDLYPSEYSFQSFCL